MKDRILGSIMFDPKLWTADNSTRWIIENGHKTKLYRRNPHFTMRHIIFFQRSLSRYTRRQLYEEKPNGITFVWYFRKIKIEKEVKEILKDNNKILQL
jgi:hypothetical protein